MTRNVKLLALLVAATLLLSGCFGGGGKQTQHVKGKVVLGDTDLGLWSTLTLGGYTLTTNDDGTFVVDLPAGNYSFQVSNLLGTFSGTVELKTGGTARLEVPTSVIPDWSIMGFNTFLAREDSSKRTRRWPRYSTLKVWIDEINPNVTANARNLAYQAFSDWEEALDGLITFQFVGNRDDAHITLEWNPDDPDIREGVVGICRHVSMTSSHELLKTNIVITYYNEPHIVTYQHELGHCLGLGHAHQIELEAGTNNYAMGFGPELSEYDIAWLKLLYSIPPGTSVLPYDSSSMMPMDVRVVPPNDMIDTLHIEWGI